LLEFDFEIFLIFFSFYSWWNMILGIFLFSFQFFFIFLMGFYYYY